MKKIFIFIFSICFLHMMYLSKFKNLKYSFFIEFDNANGMMVGTPVKLRGIQIGTIQNLQLKSNCVLALAEIYSHKTMITKDSIFETTQTGLLNDTVIDIIPLKNLQGYLNTSPISLSCNSSKIICNNTYILGDRGLNYDDLVRSTTRISQRFDDPGFFYLFYMFLTSSVEVAEGVSTFLKDFSYSLNLRQLNK